MGFDINIDLTSVYLGILNFASQDPLAMTWQLFSRGGWVIILIVMVVEMYKVWLDARQGQFKSKWKYSYLAIDVPRNNELTPKAVENIFSTIAGAQSNANIIDKYWHGKTQESFSFELVSLEGYTQFIIRTPSHFRDLVEAALYAQYPDAEITEVDDYTKDYANLRFPNENYNLWGTELIFTKDYPYPIKTYPEFEHTLSQSFIDPMASILEIMSRLSEGEQLWLQIVVTPLKPPGWGETAKKVVNELMGKKYEAPKTFSDTLEKPFDFFSGISKEFQNQILGPSTVEEKKKEDPAVKMQSLSPGERSVLERVQTKLGKPAFGFKFRVIYLGKKEVFNKGKGVTGIMGSLQQFSTTDANGFKGGPRTKTGADYFRVGKRVAVKQNKILRYYCSRTNYHGEDNKNLLINSEELASIWHFPIITVKATQVEMIQAKKAAPPTHLPYHRKISPELPTHEPVRRESQVPTAPSLGTIPQAPTSPEVIVKKQSAPPSNLPTL
ncbi:MAG: hypothetical protein WC244_04140 [Patescibacteria group bacterium]|jgi:hypothetical protein